MLSFNWLAFLSEVIRRRGSHQLTTWAWYDYLLQTVEIVSYPFALLTIISIPAYITYFYGGRDNKVADTKTFFSLLSLGNLGQTSH